MLYYLTLCLFLHFVEGVEKGCGVNLLIILNQAFLEHLRLWVLTDASKLLLTHLLRFAHPAVFCFVIL